MGAGGGGEGGGVPLAEVEDEPLGVFGLPGGMADGLCGRVAEGLPDAMVASVGGEE